MDAHIRDLVTPLIGLGLEIGEIPERTQGPEVVPDIVNSTFLDLPFFVGLGHIASNGSNVEGPQKRQKVLVEPHQRALPLQDCGEHVVMDKFLRGALEKVKGIEETAVQGVLPLRVGKLQIQQTAMTLDHCQAIEFTRRRAIGHGAEMAPVDLALDAGGGFKADERVLLLRGRAQAGEVLPYHGDPAREALLGQALPQHDGRHLGVELQHAGHRVFKGIELTGFRTPRPRWRGIVEIFAGRWSTDAQGLGDLPHREALMRQAVDLKDGALVNHGLLPESCG